MNLQKVDITIKQVLEPCLEKKKHPWILGKLKIALMKKEDQDVSTAMYMDILQENVGSQRKKKRQGNATNMTK